MARVPAVLGLADQTVSGGANNTAYSIGTVTSGTGGPLLMLSIGSGTTSPGNWIAPTLDEAPMVQGGSAATTSMDIWNAAGAASLNFELSLMTVE